MARGAYASLVAAVSLSTYCREGALSEIRKSKEGHNPAYLGRSRAVTESSLRATRNIHRKIRPRNALYQPEYAA